MASSIVQAARGALVTVYHWLPLQSDVCPVNPESPFAGPGLDYPAGLKTESLFEGETQHVSSGNKKPKIGSRAQQRHQKVEPGLKGFLRYPSPKSVEANRPQIVAQIKRHLKKHDLLPAVNQQQQLDSVLDCVISGKTCTEELAAIPVELRDQFFNAFWHAMDNVAPQDGASRSDGPASSSSQQAKQATGKNEASRPATAPSADRSGAAAGAGSAGSSGTASHHAEFFQHIAEKIVKQLDRRAEEEFRREDLQQVKTDLKKYCSLELEKILFTDLQERSGKVPTRAQAGEMFMELIQLSQFMDCMIGKKNCDENLPKLTSRQTAIVSVAIKQGTKSAKEVAALRHQGDDLQERVREVQ